MSDAQSYLVGEARIARVVDCVLDSFPAQRLFPEWQDADRRLVEQTPGSMTADGRHVRLSVHSWVVERQGETIIVDTGSGNGKERPHAPYFDHLATSYLARLGAIGVSPEKVDYVLHTHLHVDHVGWNTRLEKGRWIPTFPNARHIFSAKEYAFFTDPANLTERNRTSFQVVADSVAPIVEAGLADMIEVTADQAIPGFSFHPTPGHTVDHASIVLQSGGVEAIFAGDVMHHPVQVIKPELMSLFDPAPERTLASRRWALDFAAERGAIWFSSHFPGSATGRVERAGDGYAWRFV